MGPRSNPGYDLYLNAHRPVYLATENGHRTHEEIMAQLERRYAELEAEEARRKVDPKLNYPCKTCSHFVDERGSGIFGDIIGSTYCKNPLVVGFGRRHPIDLMFGNKGAIPALCGPEKALWEPKLTLWQRLWRWLEGVFG